MLTPWLRGERDPRQQGDGAGRARVPFAFRYLAASARVDSRPWRKAHSGQGVLPQPRRSPSLPFGEPTFRGSCLQGCAHQRSPSIVDPCALLLAFVRPIGADPAPAVRAGGHGLLLADLSMA